MPSSLETLAQPSLVSNPPSVNTCTLPLSKCKPAYSPKYQLLATGCAMMALLEVKIAKPKIEFHKHIEMTTPIKSLKKVGGS